MCRLDGFGATRDAANAADAADDADDDEEVDEEIDKDEGGREVDEEEEAEVGVVLEVPEGEVRGKDADALLPLWSIGVFVGDVDGIGRVAKGAR